MRLRRGQKNIPSCPACTAEPDHQARTWVSGEPAWRCVDCGCLRAHGSPGVWFNLDERVVDPMPNDEWMGASGAEVRDLHYEPFPHVWDFDLAWCRSRFAISSGLYSELASLHDPDGRDVLDIPSWIIRAALVALPAEYRQPEIW